MGVPEWPGGGTQRHVIAFVTQVKISDLAALAENATVAARVQALRRGLSISRIAVFDDVTIYRLAFPGGGAGYACLIAGDAVLATAPSTLESLITANGG